jgi:putative heme-binding domain-containing protein
MTRRLLPLFGLAALAALGLRSWQAQAQPAPAPQWIWYDEGNPLQDAPAETCFFRRAFTLDRPGAKGPDDAALEITADNGYAVWVNGTEVGSGNDWMALQTYDVKKLLVPGKNVLAVQARNEGGPAGLLVRLTHGVKGQPKQTIASDAKWKATKSAARGWEKIDYDDSKWKPARALVEFGGGPWGSVAQGQAGPARRRFTVPDGFRIEPAVQNPAPGDNFSLVNMTFDGRGRLLVSREGGPVLLCTDPDEKGVCQTVRPYCKQVTNCQGMCWVKDSLFLVGDGPQGTGLYRYRESKNLDPIDDVKLIHRFNGGMGEHGPHAVVYGPDGLLYVAIGNHAWARLGKDAAPNPARLAANSPLLRWPTGGMGPDQGRPGSTEDVLLPRLNDANGHAANILAPGGTVWRMDLEGRDVSLVAAGFRNHFDVAFSPDAEMFTFDSDMEWDEGLPWYRAVRACHCTPGADFVWRTGAANTPNYYIDSLPPLYETGRGSPVGLEFYDHHAFPPKYRGAYFMADWSIGVVYAVHLKRDGATYEAEVEKFCTGSPMNVTDLGVGPDGALYLTLGGRGSQGGVYRIVSEKSMDLPAPGKELIDVPQPLAAWSRAQWVEKLLAPGAADGLRAVAEDPDQPAARRVKALTMLHHRPDGVPARTALKLVKDRSPEVRAHAVWILGIEDIPDARAALVGALDDKDEFVNRRACEALVRRGIEPPVETVVPLLSSDDRFLRTAARLALQRIEPGKWVKTLIKDPALTNSLEGIVALCKTDQVPAFQDAVWSCLGRGPCPATEPLLQYLRTVQLALLHTAAPPRETAAIARTCDEFFPHKNAAVNRELAILLTHFRRAGILQTPVHAKLLKAIKDSDGDRPQQIHYFYCLRLLHDGWTAEQKVQLLAWYDGTRSWTGGHSFSGFLENILRDAATIFTADDAARLLAQGERYPQAALVLLRLLPGKQAPSLAVLGDLYARLAKAPASKPVNDLKAAIIAAVGKKSSPEAQAALRRIADADPAQREAVARSLAAFPTPENFPYLVHGLHSPNKLVLFDVVDALKKDPAKPKADDPAPYRAVLLASARLDEGTRWKAVELLRHWSNNRQFGADDGEWKPELASWSRWFHQAFPKEPPLPNVAGDKPVESRYKFDELLEFLQGEGRSGDAVRGRAVFEKALCLKCHKYGTEGEGIGPDLTALSRRFKRVDVLESIYYPSKVISDQYRSTLIVTKKGQQLNGLAAVQGDNVTVLLSDGSKVTLKKDQIDQQFASLVSVMPEKLLDPLTKAEIADLFAFLESEPAK